MLYFCVLLYTALMITSKITGTKSVSELRGKYKVSPETWQIWINKIPGLNLTEGQRIYTPKQVELIILHLGEPEPPTAV